MAIFDSGPRDPTAAISDGTGVEWLDTANCFTSDDARSTNATGGGTSQDLHTSSYGFTIPSGSTIKGILVEVERKNTIGTVADHRIQLYKAGVLTGDNKSAGASWTGTDAYVSFGGLTDMWNTTWTPEEINATDFGAAVACVGAASGQGAVDHVRITVRYDTGDLEVFNQEVFLQQPSLLQEEVDVVTSGVF